MDSQNYKGYHSNVVEELEHIRNELKRMNETIRRLGILLVEHDEILCKGGIGECRYIALFTGNTDTTAYVRSVKDAHMGKDKTL